MFSAFSEKVNNSSENFSVLDSQDLHQIKLALSYIIPERIGGGWGGALPYKPIRDMPFFRVSFFSLNSRTGIKIDRKFLNRLLFIQEKYKNVSLLFFENFIPNQGIEMPFCS